MSEFVPLEVREWHRQFVATVTVAKGPDDGPVDVHAWLTQTERLSIDGDVRHVERPESGRVASSGKSGVHQVSSVEARVGRADGQARARNSSM